MEKVAIVIPSYEPDQRLLALLTELAEKNMGPVILINDGSMGAEYDEIFEKAKVLIEKCGGKFLAHEVNQGKGRALKTAFSYILENETDVIACVTADSDGQHTCDCIQKVIDEIKLNKDALVLGVRQFDLENVPWKSRFGNNLTKKIFKYVTGEYISDTQTGLRGIPRSYMADLLNLKGERFEFEMRMLVDAVGKLKIIEVPIETIYDSTENHQTHFDPFRDSIRIYRILGEKFLKFIISSLSSCIIDLALFSLFCAVFKKSQPVVYVTIATILARVVSVVYNYILNYKVVFKSKENVGLSALKYILLALIQMACSAGLVTALVAIFPNVPNGVEVVFKLIVDTLLFFISYTIQQKLVFRKIRGSAKKAD